MSGIQTNTDQIEALTIVVRCLLMDRLEIYERLGEDISTLLPRLHSFASAQVQKIANDKESEEDIAAFRDRVDAEVDRIFSGLFGR